MGIQEWDMGRLTELGWRKVDAFLTARRRQIAQENNRR